MKLRSSFKKAAAFILVLSLILSALVLVSCGNSDNNEHAEVPESMKSDERSKVRNDIDENDRAGYIEVINKYIDYLNGDPEGMRDLRPADFYKELSLTPDEFVEMLKERLGATRDSYVEQFGEDVKVTYEITSEQNYESELESLRSTLQQKQNIDPGRVIKAYVVHVKITTKGSKSEDSRRVYMFATNIEGKWYLVSVSGEFY